MTATCTVERRAATGQPFAAVDGLAALACSFQALATTDTVTADAAANVTDYVVAFPPRVFPVGAGGVRPDDRLRIVHTVPGVPSPLVLDVVGQQPSGSYEVTRRVRARLTALLRGAGGGL